MMEAGAVFEPSCVLSMVCMCRSNEGAKELVAPWGQASTPALP